MPVLPDHRHEKFAQLVFSGQKPRDAYLSAGYAASETSVDAASSRLLNSVKVQERLTELKEAMAEKVVEKELLTLDTAVKFMLSLAQMGANMAKEKKDPAAISAARGAMAEAAKLSGLYPEKTPANTIYLGVDGKPAPKPGTAGHGTSVTIVIQQADSEL